jgi:hypothetical protein
MTRTDNASGMSCVITSFSLRALRSLPLCVIAFCIPLFSPAQSPARDLVNPFIGTGGPGHTTRWLHGLGRLRWLPLLG